MRARICNARAATLKGWCVTDGCVPSSQPENSLGSGKPISMRFLKVAQQLEVANEREVFRHRY
jgi:hypothetical protein